MTLLTTLTGSGVKRVPDPVKRVSDGSRIRSKGPECCPSQALGGPGTLDPGYLDLSNTYPGSPLTASGYRVRTAEDTRTEEQLRCSVTTSPGRYWPVEPRGPSLHRGRTGRDRVDGRVVPGTGRGVPWEGRYGPSGPPRAITTTGCHPPSLQ